MFILGIVVWFLYICTSEWYETYQRTHSSYLQPALLFYIFNQDADLKRTVDESCRIQRGYGHYFDLCLVNDNMERTFQQLQVALQKLYNEPQWVPVSWVY